MNKLEIVVDLNIGVKDNGENHIANYVLCSNNYEPNNVPSMFSAINKTTQDIESITDRGLINVPIVRTRIKLVRENGTIIDEFDPDDFETANDVIKAMSIV